MPGTPPPKPEELARWLLASEGGAHDTVEEYTMTAIYIYERLRVHLVVFLGPEGFDALWARALHIVRRTFSWQLSAGASHAQPLRHALDIVVQERTPAEAYTVLLAIFTQFLVLLWSFIGADLGFRLLQQHWPALSVPPANEQNQEMQP